MERYRIVYYNRSREASEAIVEAEEGTEAVRELGEDVWKLCTVTSLGPAPEPAPEHGSASYPWGSREERLANSGPDA